MNYLAHLFLSNKDPLLLVGNFIADSVRGNQILAFPERVQLGIRLHRQIDAFTDAHAVVQETKERLRPKYRKYASVIADIYYDHFLAANFRQYSNQTLESFAAESYSAVQAHRGLLPPRVKHLLPHMIQHNWLVSYAQVAGAARALQGLSTRATFISGMETAGVELQLNYNLYQAEFMRFFPELQAFVAVQISLLDRP